MYSFFHQRMILQILCVMIFFTGNTLFAFSPEPTLEPVPKPCKKYLGVTLSQNFAYRNYDGTDLPYPFPTENYNNEIQPSISFGLHFESCLSSHPYAASLKFKLLYEQYTSTLSQILPYKDPFLDSIPNDFTYKDMQKLHNLAYNQHMSNGCFQLICHYFLEDL